jgi:sterol 14-demethylase
VRLAGQPVVVLLGPEYHRFFFADTDRRLPIRAAYPYFVRMFDREFYFFAKWPQSPSRVRFQHHP